MASGPAGYTDASFSIIVGVRDLRKHLDNLLSRIYSPHISALPYLRVHVADVSFAQPVLPAACGSWPLLIPISYLPSSLVAYLPLSLVASPR